MTVTLIDRDGHPDSCHRRSAGGPDRLTQRFRLSSGWNALLAVLAWIGTAFGALLPFLPLGAVLVLLGWWLIRRRQRRAVTAAAQSSAVPALAAPIAVVAGPVTPATPNEVISPETVGAPMS